MTRTTNQTRCVGHEHYQTPCVRKVLAGGVIGLCTVAEHYESPAPQPAIETQSNE